MAQVWQSSNKEALALASREWARKWRGLQPCC